MNAEDRRFETARSLIDFAWKDIHHSRNQDWKFWVVLTAISVGLAKELTGIPNNLLVSILAVAAVMVAAIATLISWSHWKLHVLKTALIGHFERILGENLRPEERNGTPYYGQYRDDFKGGYAVAGVIFSFYATVTVAFLLGPLLARWVWLSDLAREMLPLSMYLLVLLMTGVFLAFYLPGLARTRSLRRKCDRFLRTATAFSDAVLSADSSVLEAAAGKRGLIKLIVGELREPTECVWDEVQWRPGQDERFPVHLRPENLFEVSFATEKAFQAWHSHRNVYEVYVSNAAISVEYGDESAPKTASVQGCLIVPPGLKHKIRLTGPTYVFQASVDRATRIDESKAVDD